MLNSTGEKIVAGIILLLVLSIPLGSLLLAQRIKIQNQSATPSPSPQPTPKEIPKTTPLEDLKKSLNQIPSQDTKTDTSTPAPQVFFGPTLNFKIASEGRPKNNQTIKIFVGIAAGLPTNNPQYLLSFTIDIPASGEYSGLSLAGLTQGATYTASFKGPSQIASSSAFLVKPTVSDLGTINLITGDLNEDNSINSADYAIAKNSFGATQSSQKWNPYADFNLDGVINGFDLGIIIKNFSKTGAFGPWISTPISTQSGSLHLTPTSGSSSGSPLINPPPNSSGGYWMWVPQF